MLVFSLSVNAAAKRGSGQWCDSHGAEGFPEEGRTLVPSRSTKAALKLQTQLDGRGPIPTRIRISKGKEGDVRILDDLLLEPGAFDLRDRGSVDFERFCRSTLAAAFFVTQTKAGIQFLTLELSRS